MTTDSNSESAPALSSVLMPGSVAINGSDPNGARPQGGRLVQQRAAILMRKIELRMRVEQVLGKYRGAKAVDSRAGPQVDDVGFRLRNQSRIEQRGQRIATGAQSCLAA